MGFSNRTSEYRVQGINLVGTLTLSSGVYVMSDGYVGQGLYLNGIDQWLDLGIHDNDCFGNVSLCNHGFSFGLWMKIRPKQGIYCHYVLASGKNHEANIYSVCRKNGFLRVSVSTWNRLYKSQTYPVKDHVWFHVGVTWEARIGLSVLVDGAPIEEPGVIDGTRLEQEIGTQVTMGRRTNSTRTRYMPEVTVDELYFWETWMSDLDMWNVYMASSLMQK